MSDGGTQGGVRAMLRLEGLALLAGALVLYRGLGGDWVLFLWLFLVPDLSFLGYVAGRRAGAIAYNAAHSTIGPLLLAAGGWALGLQLPIGLAAIWAAHVGFDRALGYGLKYADGFGHTHLGRIGRKRYAAN